MLYVYSHVACFGVLRHFQQHFSYIVAVSGIGGGNRTCMFQISLSINTNGRIVNALHKKQGMSVIAKTVNIYENRRDFYSIRWCPFLII